MRYVGDICMDIYIWTPPHDPPAPENTVNNDTNKHFLNIYIYICIHIWVSFLGFEKMWPLLGISMLRILYLGVCKGYPDLWKSQIKL